MKLASEEIFFFTGHRFDVPETISLVLEPGIW